MNGSPKSREGSRCWTYFVTHHDWCDHLLLYEDGSFLQGSLGGSGSWRLSHRHGGLLLELTWLSALQARETFVSPDGQTRVFIAGTSEMTSESDGLPLSVTPEVRRALVFSSIGSQCLPVIRDAWLGSPREATFDLVLVYYKAQEDPDTLQKISQLVSAHPFASLHLNDGMKWPNFCKWVEEQGGPAVIAARYDYVWVVDDDVRLSTRGINEMFSILRQREQIQFACPSFDAESEGVWRYFDKHDPRCVLRYTDFVECTAPVVKTSMLLDPVFQRCVGAARTGCFLDYCFHPAAGARHDAVAILDVVQCHHPPRTAEAPSEMRSAMAWEDHKNDAVFFEAADLPREWWWYRKPAVFSSEEAHGVKGVSARSAPDEARDAEVENALQRLTAQYEKRHGLAPEAPSTDGNRATASPAPSQATSAGTAEGIRRSAAHAVQIMRERAEREPFGGAQASKPAEGSLGATETLRLLSDMALPGPGSSSVYGRLGPTGSKEWLALLKSAE